MNNIYLIIAVFSVSIAACSQVLLKLGAEKKYPKGLREYLNPYVISGYGMLAVSMILTIIAYRGLDYLSVPVTETLGYVLVPVLSYIIFKEKLNRRMKLGFLCILAGIFLYYV
ncbi:MAG: multidrug ABC transporter [Lachnospiraceae bacterium]|nr:multidrug ABC transporter [Lachnospiraceae bacterium]